MFRNFLPFARFHRRARCTGAAFACLAMTFACGCGTGTNPNAIPSFTVPTGSPVLTAADVKSIVTAAAASVNVPLVIAVTDRQGQVLAVYSTVGAPTTAQANFGTTEPATEVAAALARTAAFFSNDQAPIGSRTVRFLSGIHFPPGITDTESAPLYGIENTNRGCDLLGPPTATTFPVSTLIGGTSPGLGIQTGKANSLDSISTAVNPGGVPIFKNNQVAGGVGVVTASSLTNGDAVAEYAAFAASFGNNFGLSPIPYPGAVVVGGVTLPFVDQTTMPAGLSAGAADGAYSFGPNASTGDAPSGDLMPERGSAIGGLTLAQVQSIIANALATAAVTRAAIRLPVGSRARFVISVADLDGSLLAVYRMPDATVFSVDVSIGKARNMVYFNQQPGENDLPGIPPGTAVTNRTISYASQPLFPEGIDGTPPGPFFPVFLEDLANPCSQGSQAHNGVQNGVVFFPGSVPLYSGNTLVGGLGVSGDGVDQDDYDAAGGAVDFPAPLNIRADQIFIDGVRLPYQKFPADPTD